jgi:hypothetical protein
MFVTVNGIKSALSFATSAVPGYGYPSGKMGGLVFPSLAVATSFVGKQGLPPPQYTVFFKESIPNQVCTSQGPRTAPWSWTSPCFAVYTTANNQPIALFTSSLVAQGYANQTPGTLAAPCVLSAT